MTARNIMGNYTVFSVTKSLVILCMTLLLFACGEDGGTSSPPGTVTVSWSAPLARSDGSGLTVGEIAGYRVYYSATKDVYSKLVDVDDGSLQGVVVAPSGTYFIVVTAYDLKGRESQFSTPAVEVTI